MRPIELLPEGERHGRMAAMRTGPLPFVIVGALIALLAGVAMLAVTSNQISDSKAEIVELRSETAAASAQIEALQPYVDFLELERQRTATVTSLANSRFDWVRTLRELSLVIPGNVWLTELTAEAAPGAGPAGEGSGSSGESPVVGPSLSVGGCATGQDAVAGFIAAVKQVDGVTRVGLSSSALPKAGSGENGGESSGSGDCTNKSYVASFKAVVAFDDAPPSADYASTGTEAEAPAAESSTSEGSSEETTSSSE